MFEKVKKMPLDEIFSPNHIGVGHFKRLIGIEENDIDKEPDLKKTKLLGREEINCELHENKPANNIWEGNYVLVQSNLPTMDSILLVN